MTRLLDQLQIKHYSLQNRLRKLAESEGEWRTVNGRHVLVGKGETPLEAIKKTFPTEPVSVKRNTPPAFTGDLLKRFGSFGKVRDHLKTIDSDRLKKALSLIDKSGNLSGDTRWFKRTLQEIIKSRG